MVMPSAPQTAQLRPLPYAINHDSPGFLGRARMIFNAVLRYNYSMKIRKTGSFRMHHHHSESDEDGPGGFGGVGGGGITQNPVEVELETLGGLRVEVPAGSEILTGRGFGGVARETLTDVERYYDDRGALNRYLTDRVKEGLRREWLGRFEEANGRAPESVLVILSDDTRPKTTPRVTVKGVIELAEECAGKGRALKKITFITGTGTHKPMYQGGGHNDFTRFLGGGKSAEEIAEGNALWGELDGKADALGITRDPTPGRTCGYPILQHDWRSKETTATMATEIRGRPVQVNDVLLKHESVIIAADVDTHPYMGASGGPYKFCVIGIGGRNNFCTHAPDMLSSPTTLPGTFQNNQFYDAVKDAALGVWDEAHQSRGRGRLLMSPVSVNVLMDYYRGGREVPHDLVIGQPSRWEDASHKIFRAYKGRVERPKDGLIIAVDDVKGYELIAALRPVANTLAVNGPANKLLTDDVEGRVGVVFNPCRFSMDQIGGLATAATYTHLVVLKELMRERLPQIIGDLRDLRDVRAVVEKLREHRRGILGYRLGEQAGWSGGWIKYIDDEFQAEGNLGEGGQRTIRLHRILSEFGQVFVGTTNRDEEGVSGQSMVVAGGKNYLKGYDRTIERVHLDPGLRERLGLSGEVDEAELSRDLSFKPVVEFLNSLSPSLNDHLHPDVARQFGGVSLTALGLQAYQLSGDEVDRNTGALIRSHRQQRDAQAAEVIRKAVEYRQVVSGSDPKFLVMPDMHTLADRNA